MLPGRQKLVSLLVGVARQRAPLSRQVTTSTPVNRATAAAQVKLEDHHLEIPHTATNVKVNYSWLRDHCKCDKCTHPDTGQKMTDTRDFDTNIKPKNVDFEGNKIKIEWLDGHNSVFDTYQLSTNFFARDDKDVKPVYWNAKEAAEIQKNNVEKIPFDEYMNTEEGKKKLLKNIFKYGFGYVKDAPSSEEMSEQSMERLGPIMVTHEGRLEIIGKGIKHNDISYGNAPLPMHTDLPYMQDPPGITYLHCMERQCEGGETLLVDGFKCAQDLEKEDPEGYEILTSGLRRFEHRPPGIHFTNSFPVINKDPFTGDLKLVRYGTIYMQELRVPQSLAKKYYDALAKFDEKVHSPEYQVPITLQVGDQVYFDNWRLIHGRTGFTGHRILAVCSMTMDNLKSSARMFEVL